MPAAASSDTLKVPWFRAGETPTTWSCGKGAVPWSVPVWGAIT